MASALVIVESPAKARTIAGYLGSEYVVESSIGHIRDLPQSAADIPQRYKEQPWARLGIDVEHGFAPLYVVPRPSGSRSPSSRRRWPRRRCSTWPRTRTARARRSPGICRQVLKPPKGMEVKRMVFHEITAPAIRAAVAAPRDIDRRLVDSQEARRILDRLYGYEVSPVLWKKVRPRLSAGRVQSVATRIVVERERERMAFAAAAYWSLTATFSVPDGSSSDAAGAGEGAGAGAVSGAGAGAGGRASLRALGRASLRMRVPVRVRALALGRASVRARASVLLPSGSRGSSRRRWSAWRASRSPPVPASTAPAG